MRSILLIFTGLFCALNLPAQITLDSMSYPDSEVGTDSLKVTVASSIFPSLAPMAGGMWDMSVVTDSAPVFFTYRVVADTPYQFADSNRYHFAGFNYQGNVQSSIMSSGILEYGIKIEKTNISLYTLTGATGDSLIIDSQNIVFSSPHYNIAFPAAYNSTWTSIYQYDLSFKLSYLAGGDTLAPGLERKYIYEKDSVIGWGKMSINDASGSPSIYLNVIQVQTERIISDSFFLRGVPFTLTMLTFFGLSQFRKDTIYEQNYYRPLEVTPLAQVEFRDAAYTQPYKATTHVQRLQNVGVPKVADAAKVKVYPNPVCGHAIYVDLPHTTASWNYELSDITGRTVANGAITATSTPAVIELPAKRLQGIYYLELVNQGKKVSVIPVEIDK